MQEVGIEKLRFAIVARAITDYTLALQTLRKHPAHIKNEHSEKARCVVRDCESFFKSDWFAVLSDVDGRYLMETVRRKSYNGKITGLKYP